MKQCEFCGASMANDASFCGECGRIPSQADHRATSISNLSTIDMGEAPPPDGEDETILSASGKHLVTRSPSGVLRPVTLLPIDNNINDNIDDNYEEDEEEKRRRAALFGMGLSLLDEVVNAPTLDQASILPGTPQLGQTPMLHGTPQLGYTPALPSAPHIQGAPPFGPGSAAPPPLQQAHPPQSLQQAHPPQPLPAPPVRPPRPSGGPPQRLPNPSPGCLPVVAVIVATVLIIIATTFGLGVTVFAPGLSLSGKSAMLPGHTTTIHGQHFLPNSSVILTLDNGAPLYTAYTHPPAQTSQRHDLASTTLLFSTLQPAAVTNTITAHGDGTFDATIQISATIAPGKHTIHATEGASHRSASLSFTISQSSATATPTSTPSEPTPTATATATPTATATATAAATATATPTTTQPPTVICAPVGTLKLGPISELSSQTASGGISLCTSGSGTLTWKASWNQNQAPWLQMARSSGTVQAPNQIQTTISASAQNLAAGTYTATVTFVALESNTTHTVNVSLSVRAGCVSATPQSLRFSGVAGLSNPNGSRDVSVTNCGLTSNWSASIDNGGNWLRLDSTGGTLNGDANTSVAVTASNLRAGLRAGTYQATITFHIGSDTATVNVTLVVQPAPTPTPTPTPTPPPPPPTIAANPGTVDANTSDCVNNDNGTSLCTITLTNRSSASSLTWSFSSSVGGVTVQAPSTTIAAGGTEQVTLVIPTSNCGTIVTVTFIAPGNTASVDWVCSIIQ